MNFYSVARAFVKILSYVFFPCKVVGDINEFPKDGGVVLCANHLSFLDAIFLAISLKRQIRFVGKDKYAKSFPLKYVFKWVGAFAINPEKADITAIKTCFKVVKKGEILGIFPEGTRVINGKVSDPMPGAIMIADKTKTPIFYFRIIPSNGKKFRIFTKTYLYVGKAVTVDELGVTNGKGEDYKNASIELMKRVYRLGE